ncbi:MAG: ABC transporter ATP-binding protein, partial [Raoultibacter sp.]
MINAVDMQEVSFSYGEAPLIEELSVSFPQGCITSIVGPNGCGNSTLVKLIDGMHRPRAGEVRVCGRATLGLGSKQRARIVA